LPQLQVSRLEPLLRVWFEDDDPQRMRIRSVPLPDSGDGAVWTTVGEATEAVARWLTNARREKCDTSGADHWA
jgi:hypothetical protein